MKAARVQRRGALQSRALAPPGEFPFREGEGRAAAAGGKGWGGAQSPGAGDDAAPPSATPRRTAQRGAAQLQSRRVEDLPEILLERNSF